jgi:ribulose-phosphate 3-epimerase
MITVIPSIIPASWREIEEKCARVHTFASCIQIDVLDGVYVPDVAPSWPYNGRDREDFMRLAREEQGLPYWQDSTFEIDLMVSRPEEHMDEWIRAGAGTLIVHAESTDRFADLVKKGNDAGVDVALAFRPKTSLDRIESLIDKAAFVQCMGSNRIGKQGTSLDPRVVGIIADLHTRHPGVTIGVDIGVTVETRDDLVAAGATRLVSGSSLFSSVDIQETYRLLSAGNDE